MIKTTLAETAQRAQTVASRATLREADDDHLWQEAKALDVTHGETHTGVERAQSYGFTAVPMKQDEDQQQQQSSQQQPQGEISPGGTGGGEPPESQQPQGDAAEAIVLYLNGSRSHPVVISIDDRRHRLQKLKPGDVALYTHEQQQLHMNKDGTFTTVPNNKKIRMQLVQTDQQQQQQNGSQSSGGAGAGGGQQKKKHGQEAQYEKTGNQYFEVGPDANEHVNKQHRVMLDDKDTAVHLVDKKVYTGGLKDKGTYALVMTEDGVSVNVLARLDSAGAVVDLAREARRAAVVNAAAELRALKADDYANQDFATLADATLAIMEYLGFRQQQ